MTIDPITAEVIRCGLETIADEMGITMMHTSRTPIFTEAHDFSTAIFDCQGRMAALAQAIPIHMGAMKYAVQAALEFFGMDEIYEGDILLVNDPYYGGSHIPDYTMFAPTFYDGEIVLFPAVRAHMADTGGAVGGGYDPTAYEIWQEGLRLSPIKIYERGRPRRDILKMLEINNRMPTFMGDIQAMVGSNLIGKGRIMEFLDKYGKETVKASLDYIYDYAERRFRTEIQNWPDGTYVGDAFIEHDGQGTKDIKIKAEVTIAGDSINVDLSGSDPQVRGFINSPLANVYSWLYVAFCCMIDEDIPKNDGLFRPLNLIAPKGLVVNPNEPAPCTACTLHVGGEVAEAIAHALEKVVPEKAHNQNFKIGIPIITQGVNPRTGKYFIDLNIDNLGGSTSGAYGVDGWGVAPPVLSAITSTSVEMSDVLFPTQHHGWEYKIDSGGPGKWRGCPAPWSKKEALAPMKATYFVIANRYPMRGFNGGKSGSTSKYVLRYCSPEEKDLTEMGVNEPLEAGHFYYTEYPGGGGWGDPLERDPRKVLEDVLDEYVSIESARRDYGVVINPASMELDLGATESLRKAMKAKS